MLFTENDKVSTQRDKNKCNDVTIWMILVLRLHLRHFWLERNFTASDIRPWNANKTVKEELERMAEIEKILDVLVSASFYNCSFIKFWVNIKCAILSILHTRSISQRMFETIHTFEIAEAWNSVIITGSHEVRTPSDPALRPWRIIKKKAKQLLKSTPWFSISFLKHRIK